MNINETITRRSFFQQTASLGAGLFITGSMIQSAYARQEGDTEMARFGDVITPSNKEGKEKHVPYIDVPAKVKAGEPFQVTVSVGKEVPHPNTLEHHIKWIQVYAKYEGPRPVIHIGTFEFEPTFSAPNVTLTMMLEKSSTIYAIEYCNIHGVWDNSASVEVE